MPWAGRSWAVSRTRWCAMPTAQFLSSAIRERNTRQPPDRSRSGGARYDERDGAEGSTGYRRPGGPPLCRAGRVETPEQQVAEKRATLAKGFTLHGLERPRDEPPGRLTLRPQRTRIWNASMPSTESATARAPRRSR